MHKKLLIVVLIAFGFTYLASGAFYIQNSPPQGDEPHHLLTVKSIAEEGSLTTEDNYDRGDYKIWYEKIDRHTAPGRDGAGYLFHGLGAYQVIFSPSYLVLGRLGVSIATSLLAVSTLFILYKFLVLLTKLPRVALLSIIPVGLSLPFVNYTFLAFPEIVAAFVVSVLVYFFYTKKHPLTTALLIGILPWIHVRFLLIAFAFGLLYMFTFRNDKKALAYSVLSIVIAASYFLFFYFIFGTFDPREPFLRANLGLSTKYANFISNIVVALTDRQYGLWIYAPIYLAVPTGFYLLFKKHKKLFWLLLPPIAFYIVSTFSYFDWNGGYSPPGRYLTVLVPLVLPAIAVFLASIKPYFSYAFVSATAIWGFGIFYLNFIRPPNFGFVYMDGHALVLGRLSRFLPHFYPEGVITLGHMACFAGAIVASFAFYKLAKKN